MNNVNLTGRLTKDPELAYTKENRAFVRFTLAVNRTYKNKDGEVEADFINCLAWEKTAETIAKYCKKGDRFGLTGSILTGSYDREDGTKAYTTDVRVKEIDFLQDKKGDARPEPEYDGPVKSEEITLTDDDLPF